MQELAPDAAEYLPAAQLVQAALPVVAVYLGTAPAKPKAPTVAVTNSVSGAILPPQQQPRGGEKERKKFK